MRWSGKRVNMQLTYPLEVPNIGHQSWTKWSCWIHTWTGVLDLERRKWFNTTTNNKLEIYMNGCTYGSQVTGCDRETDCQWCRSSNIRTTLITNAMHNKDQHECDQCFDNDALNWLQILVQQSVSQHSIQNIGWSCELISLKGRKIIEISNFVL